MNNPTSRLQWLFQRYQQNECTPDELQELQQLIRDEANDAELNQLLSQSITADTASMDMDAAGADRLFDRIVNADPQTTVVPLVKRTAQWRWMAAAASIAILLGVGMYFLPGRKQQTASLPAPVKKAVNQIQPGRNAALLTLADGSTISLDSAANGPITAQGTVQVLKLNDRITYASGKAPAANAYNTLSTARGNQYQLQLADGTKVWLNAASSIRFPVAFDGKERRVSITGEAYFEVAHNASAPFKVSVNEMEITVLGTRFNVNAYSDEASINTTLLEGSVQLNAGAASKKLKPQQQARLNEQGALTIAPNIDTDEIMAWKSGSFMFNEASIESIMRQISRWYNVDIVYRRKLDGATFSGIVSRQTPLPQVLRILEAGGVAFQINENQIIIQ